MSTPRTTAEEKVGAWSRVFEALREEITPQAMRGLLDAMTPVKQEDNRETTVLALQAYVSLARLVTANDRAAALSAAMLVSAGVKPTLDLDPDEGD